MVRVIDALAEVHLQCVSSTARRKTLLQRLPYVPQMWLNTISHLRAIATDGHQVDADGGTQKKIRHWGVQATKEKARRKPAFHMSIPNESPSTPEFVMATLKSVASVEAEDDSEPLVSVLLRKLRSSTAPQAMQDGWSSLSALGRLLILSDGSMTRHLEALTSLPTQISIISEAVRLVGDMEGTLHPLLWADILALSAGGGHLLVRLVWLRSAERAPSLYACSWWNERDHQTYLADQSKPIWASLQHAKVELFRQIRSIHYLLPSPALQDAFGVDDGTQLWARHYTFVKSGKLLAVIFECFNPALVNAL